MIMSRRIFNRLAALAAILLCAGYQASAQAFGSFTPYSIYGIGDISDEGTAYNRTMGGVGLAARDHRYINPVNPAAVTARDTLAFMADFSLYQDNRFFSQGDRKSAKNTANIGDMIISFPIYRSSAMMIGVKPFSGTGFGYISSYDDKSLIAEMGDISYAATGQGALSEIFVSAGVTLFDKVSLGVEMIHYFGNISKSYYETISDNSYLGAKNGFDIVLNGTTGKFGLQVNQKLGKEMEMVVGATYRLPVFLRGSVEGYRYSTGEAATDTLYYRRDAIGPASGRVQVASEIGIGLSLSKKDKWAAEIDYTRSDWSNSGMDRMDGFAGNLVPGAGSSVFSGTVAQSVRAGFEFIPNRGDMRYYFNNCAYRVGAVYKQDYYKLDGHNVTSFGVTVGTTLPVFRWYNGLTLGAEFGRRGTLKNNLIKENYINFSIGVNLFDVWFQKPKYD